MATASQPDHSPAQTYTKAFLDTTVLADVLLDKGKRGSDARAALAAFKETQLPVYAIKEFKAGPLRAYVWLHNKFVVEKSYEGALTAVEGMARTLQRNLTSSALEALVSIFKSIGSEIHLIFSYDGI